MAKSVWHGAEELKAHEAGKQAAVQGLPRKAPRFLVTYNERAAFNDGWDLCRSRQAAHRPSAQPPRS